MAGSEDAESALTVKVRHCYGVRHCILTGSARSAYALYLRATQLDGEIVMQSFMHTPTGVLLRNHGLQLAFCDVNRDFCTSVEHLEKAVSDATRAVMVTHMFGRAAPIDEIEEWGRKRSIQVLSNMVHMPGDVLLDGRPLAAYGDVAFLSFNMDKPLNGIYGGALLTDSDELYEKARAVDLIATRESAVAKLILRYLLLYRYKAAAAPFQYVYYAVKRRYFRHDDVVDSFESFAGDHYKDFYPSKIHPWQAAFAEKLIDRLPEMMAGRRSRALRAIERLSTVDCVELPLADRCPNTYHYFPVIFDSALSRYDLGVFLTKAGYEAKWRYYPLHLQQKFSDCRCADLSNTMSLWQRYLLLPIPYSPPPDIDAVTAAVAEYVAGAC